MKNEMNLIFWGSRPGRVSPVFSNRIVRAAASAILTAGALAAQAGVLPLPASQASTVPSNGDVNPYGVAFVPNSVATDGMLRHRNILVSNFNNNQNLQGTGTTIVQISPQGQTSLFYQSNQASIKGFSAALGILANGIVVAGYLPSADGTSQTAGPGGLAFIDRNGKLLGTITNSNVINGPWGMALWDRGNGFAQVYISNVEAGTITRLNLNYDQSGESASMITATVIGAGFTHSGDPAAFEVGPSGLAYDANSDVLFIGSEVDSSVYAIAHASTLSSPGTAELFFQDNTHLHGPLDLVITPDAHLLVANSDGRNADPNQPSELTEYDSNGKFVSQFSLDPNNGGAFGLSIFSYGNGFIRVAAVDDNQNILNMWTTIVH